MMNQDPFQSYQTGAYPFTGGTPFGSPYATALSQVYNPGLTGYGMNQPHLGQSAGWQNPLLQNPLLQNPLLQNPLLQNPLLQQSLLHHALLQNQLQQLAWQNPYATQGHFWPQTQQFGSPLASQGLIGGGIGQFGHPGAFGQQGGIGQQGIFGQPFIGQPNVGFGQPGAFGQPYGQIHPLAHLALRQATPYGASPFGCTI